MLIDWQIDGDFVSEKDGDFSIHPFFISQESTWEACKLCSIPLAKELRKIQWKEQQNNIHRLPTPPKKR